MDKAEIVQKFNEYFVSIGSRLAATIPASPVSFSDHLTSPNLYDFALYETSPNEIIEIVDKLKNKWSSGFDNIPVTILKASIIRIAEPISQLINYSFITGNFPDPLKIAKVSPIFKTGEKTCAANYRPISILPSFSKIFEKAVFNRFTVFLERNNILIKNQYGFRQNHSTYMAILEMYDKISAAIDDGEFAVGIFLDLSKAFDTLDHDILIAKLDYYGVRGVALDWFKSYLHCRKQYVLLNGQSSTMSSVVCGVPQGSILGPLLFILYINDIVNCSDILHFILFADDTNLFYSHKDLAELFLIVNWELSKLSEWFRANKLSLNAIKSNFILFGHKRMPQNCADVNLFLDGNRLERVTSTKFLGVFLDEKLKWTQHLNHVAIKLARGWV